MDALDQLLALHVTAANEQDRAQVARLAQAIQQATEARLEVPFVDQGYTGPPLAVAAEIEGFDLPLVKWPTARQGFIPLPRRWVVQRSFGWISRFRRLARDYGRSPRMLLGRHFTGFACLFIFTWSP